MAKLVWDKVGERFYETGVDHGILYPTKNGQYQAGVAWNGLSSVSETPSGAETTPTYADNIKYFNMTSAEDFGGTIECFTYPDEWKTCNGEDEIDEGIVISQQARVPFGLCYRTRIGNDLQNDSLGYKLHIVYGCTASPSERTYSTVNDSPEPLTFSYEFSTTPVPVTGKRPTALLVIDSTKCDPSILEKIEEALYGKDPTTEGGTDGKDPKLLMPDEIISMIAAG